MKVVRIFKSGNSRAIRLPKEIETNTNEFRIFKKGKRLILEPLDKTWANYFKTDKKFSNDFPDTIDDFPLEEGNLL